MSFNNLNEFIATLDEAGELKRIDTFVNPQLEIAEITDRVVKSRDNKALLFTNNGTAFPLLINALGSEKRICLALRCDTLNDKAREIEGLFKKITRPEAGLWGKLKTLTELRDISRWMPKRISSRGSCQQVVMADPELNCLPVLKCWPYDGGSFITLPVVHTVHPETGIPNAGMYRMQVYDKQTTGMHWHLHKGSAKHYNAYKEKGLRMPVSVALGGDPVYAYTASAPLPEDVDEYILAGFLRKKKVTMVKCLTNNLYVPEDADFVIEGYIDTSEPLRMEGPFGDHTGFYSLPDLYPVFHVTCITHRRNAIYPATIVGIPPQEDAWMGKATERIFLSPIRLAMLPEVIDMNLPPEGVFHNIALVSINNAYKGHAFKVMNALWGAGQMMFNKFMIVTNAHTDVNNYRSLLRTVCLCADPERDILMGKGPLDVLDHATDITGFGGKLGIDATNQQASLPSDEKQIQHIISSMSEILQICPEVKAWNEQLIIEGLNLLIISVQKNTPEIINKITRILLNDPNLSIIRYVVFIEPLVSPYDLPSVVWRSAGNTEPGRDISLHTNSLGSKVLVIDATMKSSTGDNFIRDWPNIITSHHSTIRLVDERWTEYNIEEFIDSPSKKYLSEVYPGKEIVVNDRN